MKGGVSSILAYGQTGSGKTFTINGILQRLAADMINTKGSKIKIHLGFMELLGNTATDLLNPGVKVEVLEDKFGKVNLVGLQEVEVEGKEQFMDLCNKAALTRYFRVCNLCITDFSQPGQPLLRLRMMSQAVVMQW